MELSIIIGENIRKLRKQEGMTQLEFAKKFYISKRLPSEYERGTRIPSIYLLINVANYFGVTLDYLCGRDRGEK